jgi:hypothetical protein
MTQTNANQTIAQAIPLWHACSAMKKKSAARQTTERDKILAASERTRQACNKLTEEERRRLHQEAFAIIYGHDAKTPARSR